MRIIYCRGKDKWKITKTVLILMLISLISLLTANPVSGGTVKLVFDDGPISRNDDTERILNGLEEENLKVGFFLIEMGLVEDYRISNNCDLVERMIQEGHAVGSHTYTHEGLNGENYETFKYEICEWEKTIYNCLGYIPEYGGKKLFRNPLVPADDELQERLENIGYRVVQPYFATKDCAPPPYETTSSIFNKCNNYISGGGSDYLNFHDDGHHGPLIPGYMARTANWFDPSYTPENDDDNFIKWMKSKGHTFADIGLGSFGQGDCSPICDDTPPETTKTVNPTSPDGNNGWYKSVITISLSATDPATDPFPCSSGVDYIEYNLDGSGWMQGTTVIIGQDGEHTLQYRSVDKAGNVEDTHTQNYKLDKANPTITKDNPSDGDYVCGTVTISGSAYDAPDSDSGSGIDYIQINIDGSDVYTYVPLPNPAYGTVSFSYDWDTTGYPDGSSHSITAKAYDDAGRSASPDVENVVVDNTKPGVGLVSNSYVRGTATVSTIATDDGSGISRVKVDIDGTVIYDGPTDPSSLDWDTTSYSDGDHTITLQAWDNAGNTNTASITVTVDNTNPGVGLASDPCVTGAATVYTTANDEYGLDRVKVDIDGTVIYDGSTDPSSLDWDTTSYSDDHHTITLQAWDKAGNTNTASIEVGVDNTPPYDCEYVPEFPAGAAAMFGVCMLMFFMMRRKYSENEKDLS